MVHRIKSTDGVESSTVGLTTRDAVVAGGLVGVLAAAGLATLATRDPGAGDAAPGVPLTPTVCHPDPGGADVAAKSAYPRLEAAAVEVAVEPAVVP